MRAFNLFLRAQSRALWIAIAAACVAALGAAFACGQQQPSDLHESDDVKGKPCFSCHSSAYNAAKNPVHVAKMPMTCQDCHGTKAWVPSNITDHHWWPILNKHVGVSCVACHTKGYNLGDTPTDCVGCHRKDYESPKDPSAGGFTSHVANGVDQYPLDCTMCHADTGFKPSTWKHLSELPPGVLPDGDGADGGLVGRHFNAPCVGCHTGTPPTFKGTPTDSDCYRCHQADADNRALAKNPNHPGFPHTCLNCHLMSGWAQGPPLTGLHPVDMRDGGIPFPLDQTGRHSGILCRDCHKLEKGSAAGGGNTDCVNCHLGGMDHHVSPAVDALHQTDGGILPGYDQGSPTTNFCLKCHGRGQHL